jgi:hypothetical protein
MDRVHCAACNTEHDLSELEPSFARPDAFFALPPDERASRVRDAGDACTIRDDAGIEHHYLRARVPVPVRGEHEPFHWVAWVEMDAASWRRLVVEVCDGEAVAFQCPATLANEFPGYPDSTLGLSGTLRVTERRLRPAFTLCESVRHPLAAEQREGIHTERVLEIVGAHG